MIHSVHVPLKMSCLASLPVTYNGSKEVMRLKPFWRHSSMVLLALLSVALLFSMMILSFRLHIGVVGMLLYVVISIAILIWSIFRFARRHATLSLTFSISFFIMTILGFIGFIVLIYLALRSFT
jgi:hypothetical protein